MWGRDGDRDARLADLDPADAVGDRDLAEVVAGPQIGCEALHLLLGHALVGLVLEMVDRAAPRVRARRADEGGDGPGLLVRGVGDHGGEVDRVGGEAKRAARHRRDQGELVSVGELPRGRYVLPVQGVEDPRRLGSELGQRCPDVGGAAALRKLELALRRPGLLA